MIYYYCPKCGPIPELRVYREGLTNCWHCPDCSEQVQEYCFTKDRPTEPGNYFLHWMWVKLSEVNPSVALITRVYEGLLIVYSTKDDYGNITHKSIMVDDLREDCQFCPIPPHPPLPEEGECDE